MGLLDLLLLFLLGLGVILEHWLAIFIHQWLAHLGVGDLALTRDVELPKLLVELGQPQWGLLTVALRRLMEHGVVVALGVETL